MQTVEVFGRNRKMSGYPTPGMSLCPFFSVKTLMLFTARSHNRGLDWLGR
jgi:hypothetical protein